MFEVTQGMPGENGLRTSIAGLRHALLSEHLGVGAQTVERAVESADGSLIAAIEALRGNARSLVPFEPPDFSGATNALLRENDLLDPERPTSRWRWF